MGHGAHRRAEAGTTLIELLVTVTILGLAVVAVVAGMATSILGSDANRKQASVHTVLVSAAEAVKSDALNHYTTCAGSGAYNASSGVTLPAGWAPATVTVVGVKYWDGSAFAASLASCPASDQKLQLVEIQVSAPDAKAVDRVAVVKRDPS